MIKHFLKIVRRLLGNEQTMRISELRNFILSESPIIIEAGASDGKDTVSLAKLFPKGTIYAFEPIPESYDLLVKNTQDLNNVKTICKGLGSKTGSSIINVSSNHSSSSLLKPKEHLVAHPQIKFEKQLTIDIINLDDFLKAEGISKVDFMWLDLQGMEYEVLSTAPAFLNKLELIYTEVSLISTYEGVMLYPEFNKWMSSKKFELLKEWVPWEDMGNALYKKS